MVFRRNFQFQKRPIHSIKHIVDIQGALTIDTTALNTLIDAVDAPVLANVTEVETRSRVNAFFLNVQVADTSTGALSNVYMYVFKNPASAIVGSSFPDGNKTGSSDLKKFIFHTEMIMTEKNTTAIPRTLFKGVISIPRHMRSMAKDDIIQIALYAPGTTYEFCVECIYKEYR